MVLLGGRYLEMIVAEYIDDLDRRRRQRSLDQHPACCANRKPTSGANLDVERAPANQYRWRAHP